MLKNWNQRLNTIKVSYKMSVITFSFAMLDYTIPEMNTYKYKLERFDQNWIDAGNQRTATYTNLEPGRYNFNVKGTNSMGIENPETANIAIVITPPFWKQIWFKLLMVALILAAFVVAYRMRLRAFRLLEIRLKETVERRTIELLSLNKILAERNNEIKIQSEELKAKSEYLIEVNTYLEESNALIERQKVELEQHQNNLEEMVEERTRQLELAKQKAEESEQLKMAFLANMSH